MSSSQESECTKSGLQVILEDKINRKKREIDLLSQIIEIMKIELIESKDVFTRHNLDPERANQLEQQDQMAIRDLMYEIDILENNIKNNVGALEELHRRLQHLEKVLSNHILSNIKPACYNSDDD